MLKIDFHLHPLNHRYFSRESISKVTLDTQDKFAIEKTVEIAYLRSLDGIAITDHDLIESSLYAKEWAKANGFPIKIISGMECQLNYFNYIHILALNISQAPIYDRKTQPADLIEQIHELGGIAILAHPHQYPQEAYECVNPLVDGIEIINGGVWLNKGVKEFHGAADYKGIKLINSDYHFPGAPFYEQWTAFNTLSFEDLKFIFKGKLFID